MIARERASWKGADDLVGHVFCTAVLQSPRFHSSSGAQAIVGMLYGEVPNTYEPAFSAWRSRASAVFYYLRDLIVLRTIKVPSYGEV